MTFAQLQIGDAVFLDANTFIYHFTPDPLLGPPCSWVHVAKDGQAGHRWTELVARAACSPKVA